MASPVEIELILCDSAVADPSGKVHMLGAGWSETGSPAAPHAVALLMKVPWDRTNQRLPLDLLLVDDDGQPVHVPGSAGQLSRVGSDAEVEVGRPPGSVPGSALNAAFTLTVPGLDLPPGRYQWRVDFAGVLDSEAFGVQRRSS